MVASSFVTGSWYSTSKQLGKAMHLGMLLVFLSSGLFGAGSQSQQAQPTQEASVVASTAWTAGIAYLGGASNVHVLAPMDLRHPPEYELRATDLVRVSEARVVIYAGYERMTQRLLESTQNTGATAIQVTTTNTLEVLSEGAKRVAERLGTEVLANQRIAELAEFYRTWEDELAQSQQIQQGVLVHQFQQQLMESLGVPILGVFGPGPLEAQEIARLAHLGPRGIIDNWHNEVAQPLAEVLPNAFFVSFINFPGPEGTTTIQEVLSFNRSKLEQLIR